MRLVAVSKYWSPSSMPMKFRPSWTQATPVLPDPMKQSTTVPPPPWTDLDQGLQELHGLLRLVVLLLGVDAVEVGVGVLDAGVLFAVAGKQAAAGIWRIYQNEIRAAGLQLPQKVETVAF